MPISFACGQCGSDYAVSDGLAGKSAICKACGARMTVPGGSAALDLPDGTAEVEPIAEPGASVDGTDVAPPLVKPAAPTFAAPAPKGASGGAKLLRLAVLVAAVGVAIYSRAGRSTRNDVQAFHQHNLELLQRICDTLKAVKDVPSAKAASGPVNQAFREREEYVAENGKKKARKADIEAVAAEFRPREEAMQKQLAQEMIRVALIPGALEALDLQVKPGRGATAGDEEDEAVKKG